MTQSQRRNYIQFDLQRELNILQTLLQKDNFLKYQNEMKKRGIKQKELGFNL
jgi:hypothetical protein